jgi:hypothetical protein
MSDIPPRYSAVLPDAGPTPADLIEQAAFDALSAESLAATQRSAEAWRNGLTGLLALVTTSVVLTGRASTASLATSWRFAATLLIGAGIALTVAGLWQALAAQAGTRSRKVTLERIHREFGSIDAYRIGLADHASQRLSRARLAVGVALGLLFCGLVTTWWAPAAPQAPPAYIRVATPDEIVCGQLQSADGGVVRLTVRGVHAPSRVSISKIVNLSVVMDCG